jgi:hypothetical protein
VDFEIAGPFDISRYGNKQMITKQSLKELKCDLEEWDEGLSAACGCYVFAIRAGRGYTPYYVGQASKRAIADEALNPSNREKYNIVLGHGRGGPVLFALPMLTPQGRYRKRRQVDGKLPEMNFLERWLITTAIQKNPEIVNNKETKFLRRIHVSGLLNSKRGESTTASRLLTKALW